MRKSHKEELYNVAFRLFILDSFDGVSIPDIEKASGFTRGAIFYYADTKQALYKQVMEHYLLGRKTAMSGFGWRISAFLALSTTM